MQGTLLDTVDDHGDEQNRETVVQARVGKISSLLSNTGLLRIAPLLA